MEFLLLLAFAYAAFVFIGESLNPFKKIRFPQNKKRRRLGMLCALIVLTVGVICLNIYGDNTRQAAIMIAIISSVLITPLIGKFWVDSQKD